MWIQITAGSGPDECALAAGKVLREIISEAATDGLNVNIIDRISGRHPESYTSAILCIEGEKKASFIQRWEGTVQWICDSPYRSTHKRKNWFVGVEQIQELETSEKIDTKDVRFDLMRSSGPGGQHVNTTESAVRVTHIPTGSVAIAQEERSQHKNKKLALKRLSVILNKMEQEQKAIANKNHWEKHKALERGNPVRVFVGDKFREKN